MRQAEPWPDAANLAFVEELYAEYLRDVGSVSEEWRGYFAGLKNGSAGPEPRLGPSFRVASRCSRVRG
jgi:2-oxoglutarate dehydrogenase complex dehydrogenase (E1) component-like enzyme